MVDKVLRLLTGEYLGIVHFLVVVYLAAGHFDNRIRKGDGYRGVGIDMDVVLCNFTEVNVSLVGDVDRNLNV